MEIACLLAGKCSALFNGSSASIGSFGLEFYFSDIEPYISLHATELPSLGHVLTGRRESLPVCPDLLAIDLRGYKRGHKTKKAGDGVSGFQCTSLICLVGETGFEPATPCTP